VEYLFALPSSSRPLSFIISEGMHIMTLPHVLMLLSLTTLSVMPCMSNANSLCMEDECGSTNAPRLGMPDETAMMQLRSIQPVVGLGGVGPVNTHCDWQCYLDRYPGIVKVVGANNLKGAERHWESHGRKELRDCTCPKDKVKLSGRGTGGGSSGVSGTKFVTLHTNFGDIKIVLDFDKAPETVANFLSYVQDGFYDNTLFHRVIDGFMIQGGGLTTGMQVKATRAPIRNEANNGLSNDVGAVAMAHAMDPHSATSQFFINTGHNTFLDFRSESADGWGYCVFGQVVEGFDVVSKIASVSTGRRGIYQDVPLEEVVITGITEE